MDDEILKKRIKEVRRGIKATVYSSGATLWGEDEYGRPVKKIFPKSGVEIWKPESKKLVQEWGSVAASEALQGVLQGEIGYSLAKWLANTFNNVVGDRYDKAIDSVYIKTHVGGSLYHHLVDGQHTVLGALRAVRGVSPDDGFLKEVFAVIEHLFRDLMSVAGINPFFSISMDDLERIARILRPLGISKMYIADALTVNGVELLGAILAFLVFKTGSIHLNDERTANIAGSVLTATISSGNPALLPVFAFQLYHLVRHSDMSIGQLLYQMGKGGVATGAVCLFSSLSAGLPIWLHLAGCFAAAIGSRYGLRKLEKTWPVLKEKFEESASVIKRALSSLSGKFQSAYSSVLALI